MLVTVALVAVAGAWLASDTRAPSAAVVPSARTAQPAGGRGGACLHEPSETPANAARRRQALAFARQVNTLEAAGKQAGDTYYALADLPGLPPLPEGFQARLTTDGESYVFSIKDISDACHFAFFSDQDGVIYTATPIR